eukprot:356031-Pyramimonas_sp.AAC.1
MARKRKPAHPDALPRRVAMSKDVEEHAEGWTNLRIRRGGTTRMNPRRRRRRARRRMTLRIRMMMRMRIGMMR